MTPHNKWWGLNQILDNDQWKTVTYTDSNPSYIYLHKHELANKKLNFKSLSLIYYQMNISIV